MRRAAAALAASIRRELLASDASAGPVLVLAGTGDNGGDALFAAAELAADGVEVDVVPTGSRMHPAAAAAVRAAGARVWDAGGEADTGAGEDTAADPAFAQVAERAVLVVDGILGTGTSSDPALRGRARELVERLMPVVARTRATVVAVDLPSGIHPDDGSVPDPTVLRADVTVTFGAAKAGLLIEPGADLAGRVEVVDLGLGRELARMTPLVERA
ncbi:NAD(P)H-hydrate epimerase [Agromyces sp. CFH 90414]|uniref:NAD(P)H-hydrate epimerase n=2 Tax=Agromyces agglutinans TaxID=2662258 RepID=A0A6I2FAW1_9MICO|nr:NAD(P)H-hydrate epimerase [Agromyces agglutinans]